MPLTNEQQQAVEASGSVTVVAGAGTGKTHMLVERYLWHIEQHGLNPLQIVTTTFTRKAADELRGRIREGLRRNHARNPEMMAAFEAAPICTMHSLAESICREHPDAAQLPPVFELVADTEADFWLSTRLEEALAEVPIALFESLPMSLVKTILLYLLKDPHNAELALEVDTSQWESWFDARRLQALSAVLSDSRWQEIRNTLSEGSGGASKNLEANRKISLEAMESIENEHVVSDGIQQICAMTFRYGNPKWTESQIEVKDKIKMLREWIADECENSWLTLEFGPSDEALRQNLMLVKQAYGIVSRYIENYKFKHRELLFSDLETGALRALRCPEVQAYYRERWQAFLIDEFQDTNPIQAEFLELLVEGKLLTIVGDEKQSIYGFRGADVTVFGAFRDKITGATGEGAVTLTQSFRTHRQLTEGMNALFEDVLGEMHQPLSAQNEPPPGVFPHIRTLCLESDTGNALKARQALQAEGHQLAQSIKEMLDYKMQVSVKGGGSRDILPKDIAILARANAPLEGFCDALQAAGIPAVVAGGKGSSLMDAPEALDAWNLLQFLVEPANNLALACVLRSPFFAVGDRLLYETFADLPKGHSWWLHLMNLGKAEPFGRITQTLRELMEMQSQASPSELLRRADYLTGYTAVIHNLPNALRREADWQGFLAFLRELQGGGGNLFSIVRDICHRLEMDIIIPRPLLEVGNAVSLMTIHASKGLEWPVVIVPDAGKLDEKKPSDQVLMSPKSGLAFRLVDDEGESQLPGLMRILKGEKLKQEISETRRVLYVALTRARDYLLLTSTNNVHERSYLGKLEPGLERLNVELETIRCTEEFFRRTYQEAGASAALQEALLDNVGSGLTRLPVTALTEFNACPKRFKFRFIDNHPGSQEHGEGNLSGLDVGTVTHFALEHGHRNVASLEPHFSGMRQEVLEEAVKLAMLFDTQAVFAPFRAPGLLREHQIVFNHGAKVLTLDGIIDVLGDDYVLDFKTDREMDPQEHRFQLWAYARAAGKEKAHLAYLRHETVHTFDAEDLARLDEEAADLLARIAGEEFEATPSEKSCLRCAYSWVCPDTAIVAHEEDEVLAP